MITYSGIHIQKIGGEAGVPTPADIAVHYGRICRFGGAIWDPLLSHCVFVGLLAYKRSGNIFNFIAGLLHDVAEVATNDVPRPFKCDCLRTEQAAIDERVFAHYLGDNVAHVDFELIKHCDNDSLDIAAVELDLPGFTELELKHTAAYRGRTAIYSDKSDRDLFRWLKMIFGDYSTVVGLRHVGVKAVKNQLEQCEKGNYCGVELWVRGFVDPLSGSSK